MRYFGRVGQSFGHNVADERHFVAQGFLKSLHSDFFFDDSVNNELAGEPAEVDAYSGHGETSLGGWNMSGNTSLSGPI